MEGKTKRFVKTGTLATALEDSDEQKALIDFFIKKILPSPETYQKINDLVIEVLTKSKFVGPGDSFVNLAATNKVALDGITVFLTEHFRSAWTKRD